MQRLKATSNAREYDLCERRNPDSYLLTAVETSRRSQHRAGKTAKAVVNSYWCTLFCCGHTKSYTGSQLLYLPTPERQISTMFCCAADMPTSSCVDHRSQTLPARFVLDKRIITQSRPNVRLAQGDLLPKAGVNGRGRGGLLSGGR